MKINLGTRRITLCASSTYIYIFHRTMTAILLCNQLCIGAVRVFSGLRRHALYIVASSCSSRTRPTHSDSPTAPHWFSNSKIDISGAKLKWQGNASIFWLLKNIIIKNIIISKSWQNEKNGEKKMCCYTGKHSFPALHHSNHSGLCRKVGHSWGWVEMTQTNALSWEGLWKFSIFSFS